MKKQDWMHYAAFANEMENRMQQKGYPRLKYFRLFNAIICRWYMDFVDFYKK